MTKISKNILIAFSTLMAFVQAVAPVSAHLSPAIGYQFYDDFSGYSRNRCFTDGCSFGAWNIVWTGYGTVSVANNQHNLGPSYVELSPQVASADVIGSSTLIVGPTFSGPVTLETTLKTTRQLRTGRQADPWEVGWVLWNYTTNRNFYYFIPKPNGWELGKADPAYPGDQRFLATGTSPRFPIGQNYTVKITQNANNTIKVWVDGRLITTFTDRERPYTYGQIGLYTEVATVRYTNVKAGPLATQFQN